MILSLRATFARWLKVLQYFTLLALLILFSAFAVYRGAEPIVDRLIEDDIRAQSAFWKRQVTSHLEDAGLSFETAKISPNDSYFLNLLVDTTDVYRFHLFDKNGVIFWSTDASAVGATENADYFQQEVAQGRVYYKTAEKSPEEVLPTHFGHAAVTVPPLTDPGPPDTAGSGLITNFLTATNDHAPQKRCVAEIYVPFMHNDHFDGAMEFYTDITSLRATFIMRVRTALALIAMAMVSSVIFATWMVRRSNRNHLDQLRRRSEQEREVIENQLRLAREVQLLGELNEWLQSCRTLDELYQMVARFMTHVLPKAEGSLYVYSNSRDVLDGCASWNGGEHKSHIHPEECWGLRRGRAYEYGLSEIDFVCQHAAPHDGRAYFCFPIVAHGETVGLMHLRAFEGDEREFRPSKRLARMCAEQISMAIANVRMRDQLQDQSVRDALTGLFNRRHMTDVLRQSIADSRSHATPLSLISLDVDHFKKFNDNYGHDAGDMVLRAVATVLDQSCDGSQIACRMGGEEFTLVLPGLSRQEAMAKAEQLRQAVENIEVRYGEKRLPHPTISLGVAHYPDHGQMPQNLLRAADEALYDAKAKGRNQVCLAQAGSGQTPELQTAAQPDGNAPAGALAAAAPLRHRDSKAAPQPPGAGALDLKRHAPQQDTQQDMQQDGTNDGSRGAAAR